MFFMMAITGGRKELDSDQLVICNLCGQYGRYQVYMTYTVLSLFFIPVFRWNRQYFVRTSCCDAVYSLDPEVGRAIARGEKIEIREEDLNLVSRGQRGFYSGWTNPVVEDETKCCEECGYTTEEDFTYCPKCGHRF